MCRLWTYSLQDSIGQIQCDVWEVIENHCSRRECTVPNLAALGWYCFRVRSWIRNRGWTEFSDISEPIQTLRRM